MIPKVIHYFWFGKKLPASLQTCIETWRTHHPDWEIKCWNENNYSGSSFMYNYCIENKKWAYASDYARFDILAQYGGIYLDTDMFIIKPLDELLSNRSFFGYESESNISCGIIGSTPGNVFINEIRSRLQQINSPDALKNFTIVKLVNELFNQDPEARKQMCVKLFPIDFFYPFPYGAGGNPMSYVKAETFAIHLWNASWLDDYNRSRLLYDQGKKRKARLLFFRAVIKDPRKLRYLFFFLK